jgi:ribonucleoside-diphosphate reductase alpha chain
MLNVMEMHRAAVNDIDPHCPADLREAAATLWDRVLAAGRQHGFRNAQATVLAPTGTISFMMDCDTTGIEPDIALIKYKKLAGRGMLKIVNQTVPLALETLGYDDASIRSITASLEEHQTIERAEQLCAEHQPVFDCAFVHCNGRRSIPWRAHITMMAAAQPFLSGAISKTVNMPRETTPEEIAGAYADGWLMGLKALAIYRDGSKESQPVSTSNDQETATKKVASPRRERLPDTRRSLTHKFNVAGHEGYITVGLYKDGRPGEVFLTMAKEGSTIGGLMDAFGTAISMSLQYGVPLRAYVDKFSHTRFEPMGYTKNHDIRIAKSIIDYIFRWLGLTFLSEGSEMAGRPATHGAETAEADPRAKTADPAPPKPAEPANVTTAPGRNGTDHNQQPQQTTAAPPATGNGAARREAASGHGVQIQQRDGEGMREFSEQFARLQSDAPACDHCGSITARNGNCYLCYNCGNSMGCS